MVKNTRSHPSGSFCGSPRLDVVQTQISLQNVSRPSSICIECTIALDGPFRRLSGTFCSPRGRDEERSAFWGCVGAAIASATCGGFAVWSEARKVGFGELCPPVGADSRGPRGVGAPCRGGTMWVVGLLSPARSPCSRTPPLLEIHWKARKGSC